MRKWNENRKRCLRLILRQPRLNWTFAVQCGLSGRTAASARASGNISSRPSNITSETSMSARNSVLKLGGLLGPRTQVPCRASWICESCCVKNSHYSRFSSSSSPASAKKPYYITTPIFYVNAGRSWKPSVLRSFLTCYSSPRWSFVYNCPHGHSQAMAGLKWRKGNTLHRYRRTWHEDSTGSCKSQYATQRVL
jgi:hypothetical protein